MQRGLLVTEGKFDDAITHFKEDLKISSEYLTLDCDGDDKDNPLARHRKGIAVRIASTRSRSSASAAW